jgi:branched-chain amino acid transport system substrate-binding protein
MKIHEWVAMLAAVLFPVASLGQTHGVTSSEIVIGSIQDLSGPIAQYGKQTRLGMVLRVDEVNEQGGVNGRKLRLIVEDSAYDPKRAALSALKLVTRDKIFAMVGHTGTAQNLAAMPIQFEHNVVNFFPGSGARQMYEPLHRLKYSFVPPFVVQMQAAVPYLARAKGVQRPCVLYQDDDFGLEVLQGAEAGLKTLGLKLVERATYKRGATDFSSQAARLKAAGCDLVVLGTIIRETVGTMAESHKIGFAPTFLGTTALYSDAIPRLGGQITDGLYATHNSQLPYLDEPSLPVRFWSNKYKTKFGEDPSIFSVYGYRIIDAFIRAATKAGANLTTDTFIKGMDTMTIPPDIFGSPELTFGPTKRLGTDVSRISQLQDGRWKVVSDYQKP